MAEQPLIPIEGAGNPQEETPSGPNWLSLCQQAYSGSISYMDTNLRRQWEKNIRQFRSEHPMGSKYRSDTWKLKSKHFRPKTRASERKAEASAAQAFFSTSDVVDISATDDNDERKKASADFWKHAIDYQLTKKVPWFLITMGAYQDSQVIGAVISHQSWDFDANRPEVDIRPPENVLIDPGAKWYDPINTSPYVIDLVPFFAFEVKDKWPGRASDQQLQAARNASMDSTRLTRQGHRTDPQDGANTGIKDFDIIWVRRVVMRYAKRDWVYHTLGDTVMLQDPVPLEVAYPWLEGKKRRPYVMGICVIETHRLNPSSPVELTASTQTEINDFVNQRHDMVRLVLEGKYWVKRYSQVDVRSLTRGGPGSATFMNKPAGQDPDVVMQQWREPGASAYQEEDRLNLDHDDVYGTFSGSSVQSNRKLNETVGGMNMLSTTANLTQDYTLKTFTETWYEPVMNQILWMEQEHETDAVLIGIAGEKAQLVERYGIDTVTDDLMREDLTLTVNLGMGATNPVNSIEKLMFGLERLEKTFGPETVAQRLDFNAVATEVFGKLGYKDGRRFMLNQDDPRVAGLLQQLAELQAKVAQKRDPEVDKAQAGKLRAEMMKIITESFFGALQGAELVAAVPEIAAVADKILEMAGYQQPVPPGVDPNIPTAQPGAQNVLPMPRRNTSPLEPALPVSATAGVNAGIEGGR